MAEEAPVKPFERPAGREPGLLSLARSAARRLPPIGWAYRRAREVAWYLRYTRDYARFRRLDAGTRPRFRARWRHHHAILGQWSQGHGFDRHYVYHPAWAARVLAETRPEYHVDISSTVQFCTMLSAFIPTRYYEYRSVDFGLSDLTCAVADLCRLPFEDDSLPSVSCMHVVEHIGLGRYGDPLDPNGDLTAVAELERVVAPGGSLLFVVPVGQPRLAFNANRVYSYDQVVGGFRKLRLQEFSLIPDREEEGGLIRHASAELADRQSYGCGCFWFVKQATP